MKEETCDASHCAHNRIRTNTVLLSPFVHTMAGGGFRTHIPASREIQIAVGLCIVNCNPPRVGDRTTTGESGHDINTSVCHMKPLSEEDADTVLNMVPPVLRNNPGTPQRANALYRLSKQANVDPTVRMALQADAEVRRDEGTLMWYVSPGGSIIKGQSNANKLIAFVNSNMHRNYWTKWYDMTGREQQEWVRAWNRANQTHLQNVNFTRGLRGTDLGALNNQVTLAQGMTNSPSLADRRPDNHPLGQDVWDATAQQSGTARRLDFNN